MTCNFGRSDSDLGDFGSTIAFFGLNLVNPEGGFWLAWPVAPPLMDTGEINLVSADLTLGIMLGEFPSWICRRML